MSGPCRRRPSTLQGLPWWISQHRQNVVRSHEYHNGPYRFHKPLPERPLRSGHEAFAICPGLTREASWLNLRHDRLQHSSETSGRYDRQYNGVQHFHTVGNHLKQACSSSLHLCKIDILFSAGSGLPTFICSILKIIDHPIGVSVVQHNLSIHLW